jgi:hypothetical protein
MSKSGKSVDLGHVFANNFFRYIFVNFFNGFEISVKFCIFCYPDWICKEKIVLLILLFFLNFLTANVYETAPKKENLFFINVS